jgi:hypothetical protein
VFDMGHVWDELECLDMKGRHANGGVLEDRDVVGDVCDIGCRLFHCPPC